MCTKTHSAATAKGMKYFTMEQIIVDDFQPIQPCFFPGRRRSGTFSDQ
jgi:hypothetical protein